MDVNEANLQTILEGSKQYQIPLYQRPYGWKAKNWQQLWDDIVELAEHRQKFPDATHFTGTLVLEADAVYTSVTRFLVVDGQQRLTTLSILLSAIANRWKAEKDEVAYKRVYEQFLVYPHATKSDERFKLRPANFDEPSFRSIVEGQPAKSNKSKTEDAYFFFAKALSKLPEELPLSEIEATVLRGLKFVTITAKSDDNVYRIFESINNTGVALTQADLIRNLVFMKLGKDSGQVYENLWLPIQEGLESEDIESIFWFDALWRDPSVRRYDTYEQQKARISKLNSEEIVDYLRDVLDIAKSLRQFRQPESVADLPLFEPLSHIADLKVAGAQVLVIRILFLWNRGVITTNEDAAEALHVVESYLIRRAIASIPVNDIGNICAICAHDLDGDVPAEVHKRLSTGRRKYLTDERVRSEFLSNPMYRRGRSAHLKLLIEWLIRDADGKETIDYSPMTIEHVIPQSLTGDARREFAALIGPSEDVDQVHEALAHTIGNLTLTVYNSELSNKPFSVKRTQHLATTGVGENRNIAEFPVWGPDEIRKRSELLAEKAISMWVGPDETLAQIEPLSFGEQVDELISLVPSGRWTTYGDIAEVIGTASQAIGNRISNHPADGAWRVLLSNGVVSSGFKWPADSPHTSLTALDVLILEGIEFDENGVASPSQRMTAADLRDRIGEVSESDE